jgi:hypothetical protein
VSCDESTSKGVITTGAASVVSGVATAVDVVVVVVVVVSGAAGAAAWANPELRSSVNAAAEAR